MRHRGIEKLLSFSILGILFWGLLGLDSHANANELLDARRREAEALREYYRLIRSKNIQSESERQKLRDEILKPRQNETAQAFDRTLKSDLKKVKVEVMDSMEYQKRYGVVPPLETSPAEAQEDAELAGSNDREVDSSLKDAEIDKILEIGELAFGIPSNEVALPFRGNGSGVSVEGSASDGKAEVKTKSSGKIVLEGKGPNEIIFERTPSKRTPASF